MYLVAKDIGQLYEVLARAELLIYMPVTEFISINGMCQHNLWQKEMYFDIQQRQ